MKNLVENEFMFKANNINSSYFYHTQDNQIEFVEVSMKIDDHKVVALHDKISNEELE